MPRIISALWDDSRYLAAVAQVRGNSFTIERWLDGAMETDQSLGRALDAAGLAKDSLWTAIGRGRVELRPQRFPVIPDAELPSVVRFQAMQQATSERLLCDFLPIKRDDRGVEVLVATAPGELADTVAKTVSPLSAERMALRPLCSAAWLTLNRRIDTQPNMLIDPSSGEIQFIVLRDGAPVFLRSVRIGEGLPGVKMLAAEAKRSLMASGIADALNGMPPAIALWGDSDTSQQYAAALHESLGGPVEIIEPMSLRDGLPESPPLAETGAVAAVLGLLQSGLANSNCLIDFAQPRKPPEPASRQKLYLGLAGAAAAVTLFVGYLSWKQLRDLRQESADLTKENNSLVPFVDKAKIQQNNLTQVERFTATQVNWLDQLAEFAKDSPPAEQMIVEQVSGLASLGAVGSTLGGGTLTIRGGVAEPNLLTDMEKQLRDAGRQVTRDKVTADSAKNEYRWNFQEIVRIPLKPPEPLKMPAVAKETTSEVSP